MLAGSGKTMAFLLPIIAVLHKQSYQQHVEAAEGSSANGNAALSSTEQKVHKGQSDSNGSEGQGLSAKGAEGNVDTAEGTKQAAKGNADTSLKGSSEAGKGPGAVILAPSRELAAQTARCLLLLLKGMKLRCTLLTAAVAAGTDFSKVYCCSPIVDCRIADAKIVSQCMTV